MPPAAPVETCDVGDPNPGRGRKRALSPDARAAAREVRLIGACGRCSKKREKVGLSPLFIMFSVLIELSVAPLDLVTLARARINAVLTYLACASCQRTHGNICSPVSQAKVIRNRKA